MDELVQYIAVPRIRECDPATRRADERIQKDLTRHGRRIPIQYIVLETTVVSCRIPIGSHVHRQ